MTDILLITVTEVEAKAVLSLFAKATGQTFQRRFIGDKTYFDLGVLNGARIMMVQSEMGVVGPGSALLVVDEGIRVLSPSAIIMVGIAFGVDNERQRIGDVLISQQLLGYELQKIATDKQGQPRIIPRGDRSRASTKLLDRFNGGMLDWYGPKVECGLLLSGEKLIDNQDFRDQLREFAPEAIGGEMEGTGLYSAAQRRKVDWIIVKAICDWADGNRSQNKDEHQRVAAETAVRFTLHVLKQGGFSKDIPEASTSSTRADKGFSSPPQERGTLLRQYDVHASWVVAVDWEPGGTRIASGGGDGTARVWDAETGESLLTYRGHTGLLDKINLHPTIYTVAWAPEGLRIVSAGDGTSVYVWNAATGQTLTRYQAHTGLASNVFAVAWSPDGTTIATASNDRTVQIWEALTGKHIYTYPGHTNWTTSVAWSPDGTRIASGSNDKTVHIWQAGNNG